MLLRNIFLTRISAIFAIAFRASLWVGLILVLSHFIPTILAQQPASNPANPIPLGIANTATAYTQNFDTLPTSGTTNDSTTLPAGWGFSKTGTSGNYVYSAGTGSSLTGDTYSFGSSTSPSDRAFGTLRSTGVASTIGAKFSNSTGLTLVDVAISYRGEEWRLGATGRGSDQLNFQYSTTATAIGSGTYTSLAALNFSTPNTTAAVGLVDGNAAGNYTRFNATILGGLNVANGGTFFIQWTDQSISGYNDGLAVDDFSLQVTRLGTNGVDTTVGSLVCPAGMTVQNGATAASTLTVNTTADQTFAGTLVDGSTGTLGLTKAGASNLTLSGGNTFSGTTTVAAGTLTVAATSGNRALGGTAQVAVNNGGALLFVSANQMNATTPAPVILGSTTGSGTALLSTSAGTGTSSQGTSTTVGLGALTLQASATIDLVGTNVLHFAASTTAAAGAILSILDWNGTPTTGGGAEAILFGSGTDGLGFLSQVQFSNPVGYDPGNYTAVFASGNNGEIVPGSPIPVPEPTTVCGGLLLVGGALWRGRKIRRVAA